MPSNGDRDCQCQPELYKAGTVLEHEKDLITIEQFIEENFCDSYIARHGQCVESEFYSKWECPQKEMDELIALLEAPEQIYIRILSYELANEYVSFRTFSNGVWNTK